MMLWVLFDPVSFGLIAAATSVPRSGHDVLDGSLKGPSHDSSYEAKLEASANSGQTEADPGADVTTPMPTSTSRHPAYDLHPRYAGSIEALSPGSVSHFIIDPFNITHAYYDSYYHRPRPAFTLSTTIQIESQPIALYMGATTGPPLYHLDGNPIEFILGTVFLQPLPRAKYPAIAASSCRSRLAYQVPYNFCSEPRYAKHFNCARKPCPVGTMLESGMRFMQPNFPVQGLFAHDDVTCDWYKVRLSPAEPCAYTAAGHFTFNDFHAGVDISSDHEYQLVSYLEPTSSITIRYPSFITGGYVIHTTGPTYFKFRPQLTVRPLVQLPFIDPPTSFSLSSFQNGCSLSLATYELVNGTHACMYHAFDGHYTLNAHTPVHVAIADPMFDTIDPLNVCVNYWCRVNGITAAPCDSLPAASDLVIDARITDTCIYTGVGKFRTHNAVGRTSALGGGQYISCDYLRPETRPLTDPFSLTDGRCSGAVTDEHITCCALAATYPVGHGADTDTCLPDPTRVVIPSSMREFPAVALGINCDPSNADKFTMRTESPACVSDLLELPSYPMLLSTEYTSSHPSPIYIPGLIAMGRQTSNAEYSYLHCGCDIYCASFSHLDLTLTVDSSALDGGALYIPPYLRQMTHPLRELGITSQTREIRNSRRFGRQSCNFITELYVDGLCIPRPTYGSVELDQPFSVSIEGMFVAVAADQQHIVKTYGLAGDVYIPTTATELTVRLPSMMLGTGYELVPPDVVYNTSHYTVTTHMLGHYDICIDCSGSGRCSKFDAPTSYPVIRHYPCTKRTSTVTIIERYLQLSEFNVTSTWHANIDGNMNSTAFARFNDSVATNDIM
jgi:hypothetical protein